MKLTAWVFIALWTGMIPFTAFAQPNPSNVADRVDTWIDSRFDETPYSTDRLLRELASEGITEMFDLERVLRASRAGYPVPTEWLGESTWHDVECIHVDYTSRFIVLVPEKIAPDTSLPVVVVGHGGNSSMSNARAEATAKAYLAAYSPLGKELNAIVVAPASSRGWGHIGNSLILSTLSRLQRMFPVDPNRIYITGQSMGGHLGYRSALSLPDFWGAVSPHSGGYDFVEKGSIGNLVNVPGYAIWGVREPYGINTDNRTNAEWAKHHELDWQFVEKDGGHEIYQDELPHVARFFADHPRDLYRPLVYMRQGGAMRFTRTWEVKGWPKHTVFADTRPLRWNMRHWIQIEARPDHGEPLTILANYEGDNRFNVVSDNVRKLSIFLHPNMVDLARAISVTVNGEELFNDMVATDARMMFELAREFDDRGRVFWARIDLEIGTDQKVELPVTD